MSQFKDREKAFESKFAHDAEMQFKAEARRNRKLAAYVGEKLGMSGTEIEKFATTLIVADLKEAGDDDVVAKILEHASAKNVELDAEELKAKSALLLAEVKSELLDEA